MSVIVTSVFLKVATMLAMPTEIFLDPFALKIFLAFGSSASKSVAVGAAAGTLSAERGFSPSGPPGFRGDSGGLGARASAGLSGLESAAGAAFSGRVSFFGAGVL